MPRIDAFLKLGLAQGCSDVHLAVGVPPMLRLRGELTPIKFRELSGTELEGYVLEILTESQQERFGGGQDLVESGHLRAAIGLEGEVLQLMNCNDPDTTEHRYLEVIRRKTAMLFEAGADHLVFLDHAAELELIDRAPRIRFALQRWTACHEGVVRKLSSMLSTMLSNFGQGTANVSMSAGT